MMHTPQIAKELTRFGGSTGSGRRNVWHVTCPCGASHIFATEADALAFAESHKA